MAKIMYPGNTQLISVTVTDSSKTVVTGATVTVDLKDGVGVDVAGCTNVSMTEADPTGSPGVYSATIPSSFNPPLATNYVLEVTAVKSGSTLFGKASVTVQDRVIT